MTSDEGLDVYGATTWGQFFVYQGFNQNCGWMHTSTGVDNVDEFAETIETGPGGSLSYRYGGGLRPVARKTITLSYRTADGGRAQRSFTTFATHHGPIVRQASGKWIAFALMNKPVEALQQSFLRTKARNYWEYITVAGFKANSSNNTLFADSRGNIAFLLPQFMPIRDTRFDYRQPVDGSDPATDWKGLHSLQSLPQAVNPRSGWAFNTNNWPWTAAGPDSPVAANYPRYFDSSENDRGRHAVELLTGRNDFTPQALHDVAFDFALEDIAPDAVLAAVETLDRWELDKTDFAADHAVLQGWSLRARPGATTGVERWRGGVAIAMTSGSTGRPKCVVQSEEAIRYAGSATIEAVGLRPGEAVAALVPLSSVAAFCFGLYLPAMLGGPQVCLDGWKPQAALEVLERHQVAWTMLVPTMALQLSLVPGSEGSLRAMTAMTVGGGPMNSDALGRAEQILETKFLRVFGMSECLGHTTSLPSDDAPTRLGRDGRPFPGTEIRVVDDLGAVLAQGEVGNTQVRGPSLFVGYARGGRPQLPELSADGFLATGDKSRVNDDGTINILGREKQIIIRGGRNIDINEVEAAVAALPGVAQVCVVPVPDDLLGERAAALVVATAPTDHRRCPRGADRSWIPEVQMARDGVPGRRPTAEPGGQAQPWRGWLVGPAAGPAPRRTGGWRTCTQACQLNPCQFRYDRGTRDLGFDEGLRP